MLYQMSCWRLALSLMIGMSLSLGACTTSAQDASTAIQIDMPADISQGKWPVTFGVPFPENQLRPDQPVTLRTQGRPMITQTTPLATWDKQGSSVRWLLVDTMVDRTDANANIQLAWDASVAQNQHAAPAIKLHRLQDHVIVDTGKAAFRISTNGKLQIQQVTIDKQQLIGIDNPAKFIIANQNGKQFEASGNLTPDGVVIEDQGPVRLTLRSQGWYLNDNGDQFGQHDIRMSFYADSGLVKILHTFTSTEKTQNATVTDLALKLPIQGNARQAAFGTDADNLAAAHVVDQPDHLSLLQDYQTRWNLKWTLRNIKTDEALTTGARWGGWASLSNQTGNITTALRDAWQNYPNEMEVRDDSLIVHFWPGRGRPLDFSTKAILSVYGEEGIANIDKYFQTRGKAYARSIFDVPNNAMGVAKTHELWIDFKAGELNTAHSADVARHANTPVLASAAPAWNAASNAAGPMHPVDTARYPQVEAALDAAFDRYLYWQKYYADFGWLDYGDIHNDARGERYVIKVEGGTIPQPWRMWDSAHYAFPTSLWRMYMRSGSRKYLQFAEANTRHCMDIDRCHYGDGDERIAGSHYYCNWSIIHWGGDRPGYVMITHYDRLDFMLMAYYLRGDRRGLDVMKQWGEAAWRYRDDPAVEFPLKMLNPNTLANARHFGPNIQNFLELYKATWDERYLTYAKDFADALVKLTEIDDPLPGYNPSSLSYIFEAMLNWWRLTGDDKFRRTAVQVAELHMLRGAGQYSPVAEAAAFYMTGETRYLDHGAAWLSMEIANVNTSQVEDARGSTGGYAAGRHPVFLRTTPILMAAMESAPASWKQQHLPLHEKSAAMNMPGPRHSTLYLQRVSDATDKPVMQLQLGHDQRATLRNAEGTILQVVESTETSNAIVDIILPEGSNGVHTLTFDVRPTRTAKDYMERGFANVICAHGMRYWAGPTTEDGKFCLIAPRLYFRVPVGVKHFDIEVDTDDTWAAYGWFPQVDLRDPQGRVVTTQTGPGKFKLTAEVPSEDQGSVWSIGPMPSLSTPKAYKVSQKTQPAADVHFPIYFKLPDGFEMEVSPRKDLLPTAEK